MVLYFAFSLPLHLKCRITERPLQYTSFGKPNPSVFKNAESVLTKLVSSIYQVKETMIGEKFIFNTIYMIGDNPKVDVNGAKQVHYYELNLLLIGHAPAFHYGQ